MTLLEIDSLDVTFSGIHAVRGVSLKVEPGEIVGIIGPNGAGKSSLLGAVGGQLPVTGGRISLDGADITHAKPDQRARIGLSRSFQTTSEFAWMTVFENLAVSGAGYKGASFFGALMGRKTFKEAEMKNVERVWEVLSEFDMIEMANSFGRELSGGQRRLVELMRCLMQKPKIILLDEPMVGVAPHLVSRIGDECLRIRDSGVALVLIEHALEVVERLCDRVVVMADGAVIAEATYAEVMSSGAVRSAYLG